MKLTQLEREFTDIAMLVGGVFLLRVEDALVFVERHRSANIPILGLDGFRILNGDKIQPLQEHCLDIEGGDTHGVAAAFLKSRLGESLWFEVVTADR